MSKKNIFEETVFLIPARKNSKGFPFKNRILFDKTAKSIPKNLQDKVFVSTDDEYINEKCLEYKFNIVKRPEHLATDTASVKDVLLHFIKETKINKKNIILLYLTYPERTWDDICKIYSLYKEKNNFQSLVCCERVKEHPFLMFYKKNNFLAEPIIKHKLFRRQDYPECIKLSLFLAIYNSEEIKNLTDLLYNQRTFFYELNEEKIDVDYSEDYKKIEEK